MMFDDVIVSGIATEVILPDWLVAMSDAHDAAVAAAAPPPAHECVCAVCGFVRLACDCGRGYDPVHSPDEARRQREILGMAGFTDSDCPCSDCTIQRRAEIQRA